MNKKFWVVNKINPNTAQILIYGYISQYDISSADFLIELTQLANSYTNIQIRINSGGGSVFEGVAIRSAIRSFINNGKNIDTYVDGIAASMAAPVAMAGSKVYISKFGRMMFHKAKGYTEGDAEDMRNYASMVESAENDIIQMIADKSGMGVCDVKEKLVQKGVDKWITAQECIDMKLADEIFDGEAIPEPKNIVGEKELVNIFSTVLNSYKAGIPYSSFEQLKAAGITELERVRSTMPELYNQLYKEHTGRDSGIISQKEFTGNLNTLDELFAKGDAAVQKCRKENPELYNSLYNKKYGRSVKEMGGRL